ncbi:Genetic interactor of prohibitins 3, mitochondrial [Madurella fahalii]|uniref:Genetic interactor of prohibitins 3, mitochondrial n=1 Tax=Madurella fahalii TaxID=1157608 RepID=A0ABQ0G5L1_9PEZI
MQRSSGRALSLGRLGRVFNLERNHPTFELPLYLCPAFRSLSVENSAARRPPCRPGAQWIQVRRLHAGAAATASPEEASQLTKPPPKTLPLQCSGCGALSQTTAPNEAGYYDLSRRSVMQYLGLEKEKAGRAPRVSGKSDEVVKEVLQSIDVEALEQQGIDLKSLLPEDTREATTTRAQDKPPVCERCHILIHHSTGNSIYHPSVESLRDTIEESPYKYNHIYHILDAADFPMSLLPRLHSLMDITLRPQNRRSQPVNYRHGKKMEMSFVISRSDLLAPTKEQVDSLMPYLQEVLRDALGRVGGRVRLGNVHCVSAKRSWWTKELKEDIWKRGGAGWMVGKVNVGKSQLFEAVFPKGRMDIQPPKRPISVKVFPKKEQGNPTAEEDVAAEDEDDGNPLLPGRTILPDEEFSLLPPPREETNYPAMPVVSPLPGTTASPIRVPFGNGRGELIDLPGLSRGDLELHIREDKRQDLIMKSRIVAEQVSLKPGRSLLLGGFIRITPRNVAPDEELVFLACAFTPIEPHVTATSKAVKIQTQADDAPAVENIALLGTGAKIAHAGAFQLRYDVTKRRTGPLTRKEAVGLKVDRLPYRVLAIDILIEGCGWVEVAVQVRTKKLFGPSPSSSSAAAPPSFASSSSTWTEGEGGGGDDGEVKETSTTPTSEWIDKLDLRPEPVNAEKKDAYGQPEPNWPVIDVYSPEGRFIGYRRPMNAWVLNRKNPGDKKARPRKSMKGAKKQEKAEKRAREAQKQ